MNKYMKMAINEAKKGISEGHGGPFGAVIVKDGKVIGTHLSTLDSQEDPFTELTDEQKKELKSILTEKLLEVTNSTCDDAC